MPYIHPRSFMPHAEPTHVTRIIPNAVGAYPVAGAKMQQGVSVYQYKMVCSCQFEVLCRDKAEAEWWQASHLALHGQQAVAVAAEADTSDKGAPESEAHAG